MKKFCFIFLIFLFVCIPVYAEDSSSSDYSFFSIVIDFANMCMEVLTSILEMIKILTTELIPSFCSLLLAIFKLFARMLKFVVTFAQIPAVKPPIGGVAIDYIFNFDIGGIGLRSLVVSFVTMIVGFKIAKRLIL